MITVIGIDPGATGAIAFMHPVGGHVVVEDLPSSPFDLADMIEEWGKDICAGWSPGTLLGAVTKAWVERAQAMPGQGVSSMFNYGTGYGQILGVLAALRIPYETVSPVVWKRKMGLSHANKDASRDMARQLFPHVELNRKRDHGRAEALLIAEYGRRQG